MKARSSIPVDSEDFLKGSLSWVMLRMVNQQRQVVTEGPPMLLLNPDESLGRIRARRTLGLVIESKCVYVQLGAGNINDIDHDLGEVVHELLQRSECQIVIGNRCSERGYRWIMNEYGFCETIRIEIPTSIRCGSPSWRVQLIP